MYPVDGNRGLFLIIDVPLMDENFGLFHLLSFGEVEGITIEPGARPVESFEREHLQLVLRGETDPLATGLVGQSLELATDIAPRPGSDFSREAIARAIALSSLGRRLGADAVVSPTRAAFDVQDRGLVDRSRLVSVAEGLALVGAYVRQRERVPLGGVPLLVQDRAEVYPLTARMVIPRGQDWWSSCVHTFGDPRNELLGYAQGVFSRVGQAIRGRDAVHEALRVSGGRSAILDALYHLDVVLTSGVGALDALARVAHGVFGMESSARDAGWQKNKWRTKLARRAPRIASIVADVTTRMALLRTVFKIRNSIHGVPLDEFLYVERGETSNRVEHRAMLSRDLAIELKSLASENTRVFSPLGIGLHLDPNAVSFLNVGQFTECALAGIIEAIGALCGAMLDCPEFVAPAEMHLSEDEQAERRFCASLAQIGDYPYRTDTPGLPATASLHRRIMGTIDGHM